MRRVGPRGAVTWPCMPHRIHAGPAQKKLAFCSFLIHFYYFKIKINSKKIPKNRNIITFNIYNSKLIQTSFIWSEI